MTVYVDTLHDYGWRFGRSCHLIADSVEELQKFAVVALGMRPHWYQPKSFPHFDLTASRRAKAIELGAVSLSRRAMVFKIRELRGDEP